MCRFFVPLQHTAQLGLAVLFETVLISSEFLLDLNLGERLNDVAHLDVAPVDERDTALQSGGHFLGIVLIALEGDKTLGEICPESNRYPDFVFACKDGDFAVECKWRERINKDIGRDLFPTDKLAIYQQFADKRQILVFNILGIGGEPCQPEQLYVFPLQELPNVISLQRPITDFLRVPSDKPFVVDDFIAR